MSERRQKEGQEIVKKTDKKNLICALEALLAVIAYILIDGLGIIISGFRFISSNNGNGNTSVAQTVQNAYPELCAFIFTNPHTENILPAVHINAYRYIYSLFDDLSFTAYMVVDSVEKYDCIDAFKRSLLPFLCNREDLVCDTADGGIRYLQTVNITDMVLNIGR